MRLQTLGGDGNAFVCGGRAMDSLMDLQRLDYRPFEAGFGLLGLKSGGLQEKSGVMRVNYRAFRFGSGA